MGMGSDLDSRTVDVAVVVLANMVNLLMVGVFVSRAADGSRLEYVLGLVLVATAVPLAAAVFVNAAWGREWWAVFFPLPLILFCVLELLLDYVLRVQFRDSALLWPYLGLYYLALLAMVGYAFATAKVFGFVTLATYFVNLWAAWYAHAGPGSAV